MCRSFLMKWWEKWGLYGGAHLFTLYINNTHTHSIFSQSVWVSECMEKRAQCVNGVSPLGTLVFLFTKFWAFLYTLMCALYALYWGEFFLLKWRKMSETSHITQLCLVRERDRERWNMRERLPFYCISINKPVSGLCMCTTLQHRQSSKLSKLKN